MLELQAQMSKPQTENMLQLRRNLNVPPNDRADIISAALRCDMYYIHVATLCAKALQWPKCLCATWRPLA